MYLAYKKTRIKSLLSTRIISWRAYLHNFTANCCQSKQKHGNGLVCGLFSGCVTAWIRMPSACCKSQYNTEITDTKRTVWSMDSYVSKCKEEFSCLLSNFFSGLTQSTNHVNKFPNAIVITFYVLTNTLPTAAESLSLSLQYIISMVSHGISNNLTSSQ